MARLESEGKGGFYPTPPQEMEYIIKRLRVIEGNEITILDPCCGKGHALSQWQEDLYEKGSSVKSYGIELEKSRAKEAEEYVDVLVNAGFEDVRMSHSAFSAMYLNPPFMRMNGERMELTFLRDLTTNYLQAGGVFIYNIPQHVLRDVARTLASRFVDIKVYRFSDANFDAYSQVIVYGVRREKGLRTQRERVYQQSIENELIEYSFASRDEIPTLDTPDWDSSYYVIPKNKRLVSQFHSTQVEIEDVIRSLESPENNFIEKIELRTSSDINMGERKGLVPAMPLKVAHLATAIASGTLPEEMGDHLLVGVSKQVQEEEIKLNPRSGKPEEVITTRHQSVVRVFSEKGIFNLQ